VCYLGSLFAGMFSPLQATPMFVCLEYNCSWFMLKMTETNCQQK
jgi:hypothetical protein